MKKRLLLFASSFKHARKRTSKSAWPSGHSLLLAIVLVLVGCLPFKLAAQPVTTLHAFTGMDGESPASSLILLSNVLYGTTSGGGAFGYGTAFKLATDGIGFRSLYDFNGVSPSGQLVLSGNTLSGTSQTGGSHGYGAVFSLNLDGSGFTNLYSFTEETYAPGLGATNADGVFPQAGLILSQNVLYGTASSGGPFGVGTVFKIGTDGAGFQVLHSFPAGDGFINTDGAVPFAGLALSGSTLYGTTYYGGSGGNGPIFAVNTDGSGFRVLYNFAPGGPDQFNDWPNAGGGNPHAELLVSGETLYGTAENGGSGAGGTVFKIETDGSGFVTLHNFDDTLEGKHPVGGLTLSGSTLYGTTRAAIFAIETNGTGYIKLLSVSVGDVPNPDLLLSGNTLYGTTPGGGASPNGTVFSFFIPARLTIIPFGQQIVLTWPTNASSFTLQSSAELASTNWTTVSPPPVVIDGQNTVTNAISATQRFYRLAQ